MHDEIGTQLSHLALLAEGAGSEVLPAIAAGTRELQQAMRDLVWLLQPGTAEARELTVRLRTLAQQVLGAAGIGVQVRVVEPPPERRLPLEWTREVLLFAREALANAARHSRATAAEVTFDWAGKRLVWRLRDDGVGFEEANVAAKPGGSGLRNLRKRGAQLGGRVFIESRAGQGTMVELECPLPGGERWRGSQN